MPHLTWGLLVATHNRPDALESCTRLAIGQTRAPIEVVVADSSPDWEVTRDRIAVLLANHPQVRFVYEKARRPSLTVQRNQAIAAATADVGFLIDDDSYMHPTCAAEIMAIYEADGAGEVAGVQAVETAENPEATATGARKQDADLSRLREASPVLRWFLRRVMMQGMREVFVPYDGAFPERPVPASLADLAVTRADLFGGFRMTYRREAVLREPFDPTLRYYCPGEDLDASYRVSRHGALVTAERARLHHYKSAASRLNRIQVAHLWSLNQAVLIRRHAPDQRWGRRAYAAKMAHRISTDVLKDLLMRRFGLPQTRGSLRAWRESRGVFAMSLEEIERWYPAYQERLITGRELPADPAS